MEPNVVFECAVLDIIPPRPTRCAWALPILRAIARFVCGWTAPQVVIATRVITAVGTSTIRTKTVDVGEGVTCKACLGLPEGVAMGMPHEIVAAGNEFTEAMKAAVPSKN